MEFNRARSRVLYINHREARSSLKIGTHRASGADPKVEKTRTRSGKPPRNFSSCFILYATNARIAARFRINKNLISYKSNTRLLRVQRMETLERYMLEEI